MRNTLALAVAVAALPFAGDAGVAAQSRFSQAPQQPQQSQQMRFANMDRNRDGVITRAEWRGTAQAFANQDWNGDGILSGNELRPGARRDWQPLDTVDDSDADSETRFRAIDSNGDGLIVRREWAGTRQAFLALDANGDNVLTRAEVLGTPGATDSDASVDQTWGRAQRRGAVATSGSIVRVDPRERWNDTGIDVAAGDRIFLDAEGSIQMSEGGPDAATPAGSSRMAANALLPRQPAGVLIGRIGESAPLVVGAQRTIARAPVSGRLYLGVNDDHLADNSGEYRVSITIEQR
jgi:hypothetical protein